MNIKSKILYLSTALFFFAFNSLGQSVIFHENFEAPSGADSITASTSGSQNWAINTTYANTGTQSFHKTLTLNDSATVVTLSFSASGHGYVLLSFAHICKVHYADAAEIYVSNNNGANWVKVTGPQYLGTGNFASFNSIFASLSYTEWQPGSDAAIPTNAWWKEELFDISSLVSQSSQVMVMFMLRDLDGQGANGNYGWLIDDIKVTGALSELTAPVVVVTTPLLPDTTYSNGPFTLNASITDASGIDTAYVVYTINGGTPDTLGMVHLSGNNYRATLPSQTYNSLICYKIVAVDGSASHNTTFLPANGCKNLLVLKGLSTVTVGTGTLVNTSTTYPAPYGNRLRGARHQFLITAAELNSAGLSQGHILSLGFDVVTVQGTALQDFTIKMGHTSLNALTSSFVSSLSSVYSVSSYTETSGWNSHVFQTPFYWNGTDNVVVETCFNNSGSTNNAIVRQSATTYNSSLHFSANSATVCNNATGTLINQRPNIRFTTAQSNFANDAGVSHIQVQGSGSAIMEVRIKNYGTDTLTKAAVYYSINNGATQGAFLWTGSLLPGISSTPFSLGTINLAIATNTIKAWTTFPNDSVDPNTINDAISITLYACPQSLNGTYSIGASGADFPSIAAALTGLLTCGIGGPVVFNIAPGTYPGQYTFPNIPGVSATKTVTFRSATGNRNDVILLLSASSNNYTVRFNGARYINLKQVTVRSTNATLGRVIVIEGNSRNITIDSCFIDAPVSTASTAVGIFSPTTTMEYNITISNSHIKGGYHGISYDGSSTTRKNLIYVINNVIEDFHSEGVGIAYTDSLFISSNIITNRTSSDVSNGIAIDYSDGYGEVFKNKVHLHGTGAQIGIYVAFKGTIDKYITIANNFVTHAGIGYMSGIFVTFSNYVNVYFNSVNIVVGTGSAVFQSQGSNINIVNNNLSYTGASTGHALYVNTPSAVLSSDFNNLYSTGANLAYWSGTSYSSLSALQSISNMNLNSHNIVPPFISATNLYLNSSALSTLATYLPDITDDINGNPRTPNPTIGAHEVPFIPNDAGVSAIIYPAATSLVGQNDVVVPRVVVKNFGSATITSMSVVYTVNNGTPIVGAYTGPLLPAATDTILLPSFISPVGSTLITAYTVLSGDSNTFNDTCYVTYTGAQLIDAALTRILPIDSECGMGLDTIKIVVANLSANDSIHSFTASYQLAGSSTFVTETVNTPIASGDSLHYTFNTLADFSVSVADSAFIITVWIDVANDNVSVNDTSVMTVLSKHIPVPPLVSNVSIAYGTNTALSAQSSNTVNWFNSISSPTIIATGNIYNTPWLFDTTIYWIEATTSIGTAGVITVGTALTDIATAGPVLIDDVTSAYKWSHHISVIDASELSNITGYVSSLSWHKSNTGGYTIGDGEFRIYLKHTTLTSVPGTAGTFASQVTGATLVYESTSQIIPVTMGWKDFIFNTPNQFLYNGSSKLMILVEWYRPGNAIGSVNWSYTQATNKAQTWSAATYPPNIASGSDQRPNVRVRFVPFIGCTSVRVPDTVFVGSPPPIDAGVYDIVNPGPYVLNGSNTPIQVRIKNFGTNNLTSVQIYHKIDGITSGPYNLTGINLPQDSISQVITLATSTLSIGSHSMEVWTSLPNGVPDTVNTNDTLHHNFPVCMGGSYSLGTPTSDFPTFASALSALSTNPICTHVVFNVEPGTYTLQLNLNNIPGTGPGTTVTFQSITGDSTDVVVQYSAGGTSDNRVVKLDGAKYFIFRQMTFYADGGSYGRVFEFLNNASYNTITNCVIRTSTTLTGTAFAGIFSDASSTPSNHVTVSNNRFIGGYYGIFWSGNSGNQNKNHLVIANNTFEEYYYCAIYNVYTDSLYIHSNEISNRFGSGGVYGIAIRYLKGYGEVYKNKISLTGAGIHYCVHIFQKTIGTTEYLTLANNFIYSNGSSNTSYGIHCESSPYVNFYYNSLNITDGDANNGRPLFITGIADNVRVKNNILVNTGGGYAYYVSTSGIVSSSDYNDFYVTGPNVAFWDAARSDLAALQAAGGKDLHSISVNPVFSSPTNLHPSAPSLFQAGDPIAGISDDILGTPRPATSPCIGAVEFTPVFYDAGLITISSPVSPVTGTDSLNVTLLNGGVNTLTSVTINWQVNGQTQTPLSWTGNLTTNTSQANVYVGSYLFAGGSYDIKVWTSQPNSQPDGFAGNDTLKVNVIACSGYMRGVYTIGGPGAYFSNFNAAVNALTHCGVDSATVFLVSSGVYKENIEIPPINGASALNTITFSSATGDSTDVVVEYTASGIQLGYIVCLNGAKHIRFKNMTLSCEGIIGGKTVFLKNGADYNLFEGCIISTPPTTLTTFSCVYTDNTSIDQYNVFRGNRILYGYYGFYIVGSNTNRKRGFVIENNVISGYYYLGISAQYTDSILILNNTLTNTTLPTTNANHLSVYYPRGYVKISKNKIHSTIYYGSSGIIVGYADNNYTTPIEVSNNFVSQVGASSTFRAIAIYGEYSRVNILNNSVHVTSSSTSAYCLFVSEAHSLRIINNSFANMGNGHAVYLNTTNFVTESDYNNFYNLGGYLIYTGISYASLAAYQLASGLDSNSIFTNPLYLSIPDLHSVSPLLNGAGKPLMEITDDIDGDQRDPVYPDIGADEFYVFVTDIGPTEILSPAVNSLNAGASVTVEVRIRNHGSGNVNSFNLGYSYAGQPAVNVVWTGLLGTALTLDYSFTVPFTLLSGLHELLIFTSMAGDLNINNDTIRKSIKGMGLFIPAWSDSFDTLPDHWSTSGSLWERGIPSGNIINTAYSTPNVWATDLSGNYPIGQDEFLYTPFFNFSTVSGAILKFYHWRAFADVSDFGQVQISTTGGSTWFTLGYMGDPAGTNWYTNTGGGQHFFSGNSSGWAQSTYDLSAYNNFPTPIQFRFRFASNLSGISDGWAIDNFEISLPPVLTDGGVSAILNPGTTTSIQNPISVQVRIKNYGALALTNIPVRYRVNNLTPVSETWTGTLAPGDSVDYLFTAPYSSPITVYKLCAYTAIAGDQYLLNDSTCKNIMPQSSLDIGVSRIVSPLNLDTTYTNHPDYDLTVMVKNWGTDPVTAFQVLYTLNGVVKATEPWTGLLNPNDSVAFTFATSFLSLNGTYNLCARTILTGDLLPANDESCVQLFGTIDGIGELNGNPLTLQNSPNPAKETTLVEFSIPRPGKVVFEMHNFLGQPLIVEQLEVMIENYQMEVDLRLLPAGIYTYSIQFEEYRMVRRMVVMK